MVRRRTRELCCATSCARALAPRLRLPGLLLCGALLLLFNAADVRAADADPDAVIGSAHDAEMRGDYDGAIQRYTALMGRTDLSPTQRHQGLIGRGVAHGRKAEFRAAIQDFSRAIALDPTLSDGYYDRALVYSDTGDDTSALADLNAIAAAASAYPDYYFNRGYVHYEHNDFDAAIADLTLAAQSSPQNAAVFYQRGKAYDAKHQPAMAAADFAAAVALKPGDPTLLANAYRWAGTEALAQQQYAQALQHFNALLKLDPQDADAAMRRAYLAFVQGRYADAVADCNRVVHIVPAPVAPWPGVVDPTKAFPDRIIEQYNSTVREPAIDPYALRLRARSQLKLGHKDSALADYAAAVKVIPAGADDSVAAEMEAIGR